jgi:hypothetical protein
MGIDLDILFGTAELEIVHQTTETGRATEEERTSYEIIRN